MSTGGQTQTSSTYGYDFRFPRKENDSLFFLPDPDRDRRGGHVAIHLPAADAPNVLETLFTNDQAVLDLDVRRLQLAYISTFLTCPIAGTIVGIYKDLGDTVAAGEAIMRVEDDTEILIVGTLIFHGLIILNMPVSITTKNLRLGAP